MLKVENTDDRNCVSQSARRSRRRQKERINYMNPVMNPGQRLKGSILRQKLGEKGQNS